MFELYQQGFSLAQVANAFGLTRQGVFKMFAKRDYQLRTIEPLPFVMFDGRKFTRRSNGYYAATEGGREYLHRVMWMAANGPIPGGWDVHHRDHDRSRNILDNFECLPKAEHARRYSTGNNQHKGGRPHKLTAASAATEGEDGVPGT